MRNRIAWAGVTALLVLLALGAGPGNVFAQNGSTARAGGLIPGNFPPLVQQWYALREQRARALRQSVPAPNFSLRSNIPHEFVGPNGIETLRRWMLENQNRAEVSARQSTPARWLVTVPDITPKEAIPGQEVRIRTRITDLSGNPIDASTTDVGAIITDASRPDFLFYQQPVDDEGNSAGPSLWPNHLEQGWDIDVYMQDFPTGYEMVGFVPLTREAGDPHFWSATYTPAIATDFYVDINLASDDGAFFSFDNIGGFTTRPFVPQWHVLLVLDYTNGQKFIGELRPARGVGSGDVEPIEESPYSFVGIPVDSYWLRNPTGFGVHSITGNIDPTLPRPHPDKPLYPAGRQIRPSVTGLVPIGADTGDNGVDIWRVPCRGRVPWDILRQYLPDPIPWDDVTLPRVESTGQDAYATDYEVGRCVIWTSPYSGDLFVGEGTLLDLETQARLRDYIRYGGCLVVSGQDVAWALTLDGAMASPFLGNALQASYVRDDLINGTILSFTVTGTTLTPFNPLATNPRGEVDPPRFYWFDRYPDPDFLPDPLRTPKRLATDPPQEYFTDAAANQAWPDVVTAAGLGQAAFNYADGNAAIIFGNHPSEPLIPGDPPTPPGRTAYAAFGIEAVYREYRTINKNDIDFDFNLALRTKILHNMACWGWTSRIPGTVSSAGSPTRPAGSPIPNARVIAKVAGGTYIPGDLEFQVRTRRDGTYEFRGIPVAQYNMFARAPGLVADHFAGEYTYPINTGSFGSTEDFSLREAPPGRLSGFVRDSKTGEGVNGIIVRVTSLNRLPSDPLKVRETTTANDPVSGNAGFYAFDPIEADDYKVQANPDALLFYQASPEVQFTIDPAEEEVINFTLEPALGAIAGKVRRRDNNQPIPNVEINLLPVADQDAQTATTDANGNYGFNNVIAGDRNLRVTSADGFLVPDTDFPVTVARGSPPNPPTQAPDILLDRLSTLSGRVVDSQTQAGILDVVLQFDALDPDDPSTQQQASTDANGNFVFNNVIPGPNNERVLRVVFAPGYGIPDPITVPVGLNQQIQLDVILLVGVPPGNISGRVTSEAEGAAVGVGGINIEAHAASATGPLRQTVTSDSDGNFRFINLDAGPYVFLAVDPNASVPNAPIRRFSPVTVSQEVASGDNAALIEFSVVSLVTVPNGLSMFGPAFNYPGQDHALVIGGFAPADFKAARWLPALGTWSQPYPDVSEATGIGALLRGRGIFVRIPRAASVIFEGLPRRDAPEYTAAAEIPLDPRSNGWNMVGSVYDYAADWFTSQVLVDDNGDGTPDRTLTVLQAIAGGILANGLFTFGEGTYLMSSTLQPWRGYWVRVRQAGVTLRPSNVPLLGSASARGTGEAVIRGEGVKWTAQIVASAGGYTDAANYIGMASDDRGFDNRYDVIEPPSLRGLVPDDVVLTFPHADFGSDNGDYTADIRKASALTQAWDAVVRTSLEHAPVVLSWPDLRQVPREYALVLTDLASGRQVNMRSAGSYAYVSGEAGTPRRLKMTVRRAGPDTYVFLLTGVAQTRQAVTVTYRVQEEVTLDAWVLNSAGRVIRHLVAGETRAAGAHSEIWDGRDDLGRTVPGGQYIVELQATWSDMTVKRLSTRAVK